MTPVEQATAREMGKIATQMGADFVLALGDNFYYTGVDSVDSPRFKVCQCVFLFIYIYIYFFFTFSMYFFFLYRFGPCMFLFFAEFNIRILRKSVKEIITCSLYPFP